jgi:hypothetical protein
MVKRWTQYKWLVVLKNILVNEEDYWGENEDGEAEG